MRKEEIDKLIKEGVVIAQNTISEGINNRTGWDIAEMVTAITNNILTHKDIRREE